MKLNKVVIVLGLLAIGYSGMDSKLAKANISLNLGPEADLMVIRSGAVFGFPNQQYQEFSKKMIGSPDFSSKEFSRKCFEASVSGFRIATAVSPFTSNILAYFYGLDTTNDNDGAGEVKEYYNVISSCLTNYYRQEPNSAVVGFRSLIQFTIERETSFSNIQNLYGILSNNQNYVIQGTYPPSYSEEFGRGVFDIETTLKFLKKIESKFMGEDARGVDHYSEPYYSKYFLETMEKVLSIHRENSKIEDYVQFLFNHVVAQKSKRHFDGIGDSVLSDSEKTYLMIFQEWALAEFAVRNKYFPLSNAIAVFSEIQKRVSVSEIGFRAGSQKIWIYLPVTMYLLAQELPTKRVVDVLTRLDKLVTSHADDHLTYLEMPGDFSFSMIDEIRKVHTKVFNELAGRKIKNLNIITELASGRAYSQDNDDSEREQAGAMLLAANLTTNDQDKFFAEQSFYTQRSLFWLPNFASKEAISSVLPKDAQKRAEFFKVFKDRLFKEYSKFEQSLQSEDGVYYDRFSDCIHWMSTID